MLPKICSPSVFLHCVSSEMCIRDSRTPSRLDPFGSSDRRMEYYFLGEEGKEESTGYLFLEFWKEDSGEYRTIGIGQKAKRGKPMDFWGFVLLDGRRVGYDLWLYKDCLLYTSLMGRSHSGNCSGL